MHARQTYAGRALTAMNRRQGCIATQCGAAVPDVYASSEVEEEMQVLLCDFCALETERLSDVFSRTLGRLKGRPGAIRGKPLVALFAGGVKFAITQNDYPISLSGLLSLSLGLFVDAIGFGQCFSVCGFPSLPPISTSSGKVIGSTRWCFELHIFGKD